MSKTVKLILVIAFVIFVSGVSWAVIAKKKNANTVATNTAQKADTKTSSTSTPKPKVEDTKPTAVTSSEKTSPTTVKPKKQTRTVVVYEEVWEESSASAWAEAGTDANGNSYAEAHAE